MAFSTFSSFHSSMRLNKTLFTTVSTTFNTSGQFNLTKNTVVNYLIVAGGGGGGACGDRDGEGGGAGGYKLSCWVLYCFLETFKIYL
jgi:hypothetical protein